MCNSPVLFSLGGPKAPKADYASFFWSKRKPEASALNVSDLKEDFWDGDVSCEKCNLE